jgi:signal transduction histidine kinase
VNRPEPDIAARDLLNRRFGLHSIRFRLPLLILALLTAVGAAFAWMAYREVEQALRANGLERAAAAATQVAQLLTQSVHARTAETRRIAGNVEVREIVRSGRLPPQGAVPAALGDVLSRSAHTRIRLHDASGRPIGVVARVGGTTTLSAPDPGEPAAAPSEGVKPLKLQGNDVIYTITAPIAGDADGTTVGYVSMERPLRSSAGAGMIERLIGSNAVIRLGNAAGDLWTDLETPQQGPPQPLSGSSARYERDGEMRLAASASIPGTPWVVWADLAESVTLAPARVLTSRMVPITSLITLLGALAVYIVCARVTRPLEQLADAAEAVAEGEYSRRVAIIRRDEIGRLGAAFNVMAARVAESHDALEARVRARTQELEAFSYSVSHDLRAPLRHIAGFASLLQKSGGAYLTEQDRRYVGTIVDAARRMSHLVDDLLGFSRMARAEMHRATVDVDALVAEVVSEQAGDTGGRQVDWVLTPLPPVRGDRAMLKVALTNLVSNAVKYTATRERARIEIGAMPSTNGERVLFVRDNGVGFDMQYADKLFGVFQRLHSADEFEGTGIGLASVQRIVQRHEGRTWAEGSIDHGATFYVALPAGGASA